MGESGRASEAQSGTALKEAHSKLCWEAADLLRGLESVRRNTHPFRIQTKGVVDTLVWVVGVEFAALITDK